MAQQGAQRTVRACPFAVAMEKGLRQSTVLSYERLLGRLGMLDEVAVSQEDILSRLWTIDNPITRRAAVIALRSVLGWRIKSPSGRSLHISSGRKSTSSQRYNRQSSHHIAPRATDVGCSPTTPTRESARAQTKRRRRALRSDGRMARAACRLCRRLPRDRHRPWLSATVGRGVGRTEARRRPDLARR